MSEQLVNLIKKGGGSGGIFPIGENKVLKYCGAVAFGNPSIEQYSLNTDLVAGFVYSYVGAIVIINCKGHTTADITTGGAYDEMFGISEDGTVTRITRGNNHVFTDYDISPFDYIVYYWQATTSQNPRQIVITN